jgi:hypothetical protein
VRLSDLTGEEGLIALGLLTRMPGHAYPNLDRYMEFRKKQAIAQATRKAAARRVPQFKADDDSPYIVGGHRIDGDRVVIHAVAYDRADVIGTSIQLTADFVYWRGWKSNQAADQWIKRRELADVHVMNLHHLDIKPPAAATDTSADLSPDQRATLPPDQCQPALTPAQRASRLGGGQRSADTKEVA